MIICLELDKTKKKQDKKTKTKNKTKNKKKAKKIDKVRTTKSMHSLS